MRRDIGKRVIIGLPSDDAPVVTGKGIHWYFLSFFFALLVEMLPIGLSGQWWRPDMLFLTMVFWLFYFPNNFGFFTLFLCGFLLDVSLGGYLGENTLLLVIASYLVTFAQRKFKFYSIIQVMILVAVLKYLMIAIKLVLYSLIHKNGFSVLLLASPITTALCLPVVVELLKLGCSFFAVTVRTPY